MAFWAFWWWNNRGQNGRRRSTTRRIMNSTIGCVNESPCTSTIPSRTTLKSLGSEIQIHASISKDNHNESRYIDYCVSSLDKIKFPPLTEQKSHSILRIIPIKLRFSTDIWRNLLFRSELKSPSPYLSNFLFLAIYLLYEWVCLWVIDSLWLIKKDLIILLLLLLLPPLLKPVSDLFDWIQ